MKKNIFIAILFICCAAQNGTADDITVWKKTESIDDFIGKWEGYINIAIPRNTANAIPESSIEVGIYFEYIKGSDEVNASMHLNLNKFLTDWSNVPEIKERGFTKDKLWAYFIDVLENADDRFSVGGKYYLYYDISEKADEFFFSDGGEMLVSETKNQVKLVFYEPVSFGLGDEGFTEIILNKE